MLEIDSPDFVPETGTLSWPVALRSGDVGLRWRLVWTPGKDLWEKVMEVKSVEPPPCVETPLARKSLSCTLVEAGEVSRISNLNVPPLLWVSASGCCWRQDASTAGLSPKAWLPFLLLYAFKRVSVLYCLLSEPPRNTSHFGQRVHRKQEKKTTSKCIGWIQNVECIFFLFKVKEKSSTMLAAQVNASLGLDTGPLVIGILYNLAVKKIYF